MEYLDQAKEILTLVLELLGGLAIVATILVRLTPSTKDDEAVSRVILWWDKFLSWAPTIGVNPKTKKLKAALEEMKSKK